MGSKTTGYSMVAISAVCFGTISLWAKWGYALGLDPLGLLVLRFGIASLLLWGAVLLSYGKLPWLGAKQVLFLSLQGGLGYGFTAGFFFMALENLPAGMASMLFYLHPLLTAALTPVLFKQSIAKRTQVALAIALVGSAFLASGALQGELSWQGITYALMAAIAYAGFTLAGQFTTRDTSPLLVTAYTTTACFATITLWVRPSLGWLASLTLPMWLTASGLAVIATVLGILLYLAGIQHIGASQASIVSALEPATGVLLSVFVLNETLGLAQCIGVGLILLGAISLAFNRSKANTSSPQD